MSTFQLNQLPIGFSLVPQIFTQMTKLLGLHINIMMYPSREQTLCDLQTKIMDAQRMGFLTNVDKSMMVSTQKLTWLEVNWFSENWTLQLSGDNNEKLRAKAFCSPHTLTITRHAWESLTDSINHAVDILPLGRIRHRRLTWMWNRAFSQLKDKVVPLPKDTRKKLRIWTQVKYLSSSQALVGASSLSGAHVRHIQFGLGVPHQYGDSCQWTLIGHPVSLAYHTRELAVPWIFLREHPEIMNIHVRFHLDNWAAVRYVSKGGSARFLNAFGNVGEAFLSSYQAKDTSICNIHS